MCVCVCVCVRVRVRVRVRVCVHHTIAPCVLTVDVQLSVFTAIVDGATVAQLSHSSHFRRDTHTHTHTHTHTVLTTCVSQLIHSQVRSD